MKTALRNEHQPGQVVVLFAIALVAMLALMAVTVDGGSLYLQRRTAQNSADAAALAAARAVQQATTSPTLAISAEICKYVLSNAFGVTPAATAYFVDTTGAWLQAISLPTGCSGSTYNPIPTGTSGAHVDISIGPYNTYLAGIVGINQLQAQASATAQVGALAIPNADIVPLAGCGQDMLSNGQSPTPFYNILNADNTINPAFYGTDMILEGSQMSQNENATCPKWNGHSSAWKGKILTGGITGPFTLPLAVPVDTGNGMVSLTTVCTNIYGAGHDPATTYSVPPDVCLLLVPITAQPNPPNQANIVTFGCFSVYNGGDGTQKWRGVLHPVRDCSYGVYLPTWTWGSTNSETQVLLTT